MEFDFKKGCIYNKIQLFPNVNGGKTKNTRRKVAVKVVQHLKSN